MDYATQPPKRQIPSPKTLAIVARLRKLLEEHAAKKAKGATR